MSTLFVRAFIGLGSNLGKRRQYLARACAALKNHPAIQLRRVSPAYETKPQGGPAQRKYLNAVAEVRTGLPAFELLRVCRQIESALGRQRPAQRWGPRTIDLDILLYGSAVVRNRSLVIPHPRLAQRLFVLQPLCDIAPLTRHPVLRKTIRTLFAECRRPTP